MKQKPSLIRYITQRIFLPLLLLQVLTLMVTGWFILTPMLNFSVITISNDINQLLHQWQLATPDEQKHLQQNSLAAGYFINDAIPPLSRNKQSNLPYIFYLENYLHKTLPFQFHNFYLENKEGDVVYWFYFKEADVSIGFQQGLFNTRPALTLSLLVITTLLTTLLVSLFIANKLRYLLANLRRTALNIRRGKLNVFISCSCTKEMQELENTFNHLVIHLSNLLDKRTTLLAGISHDLRTPLTRINLLLGIYEPSIPNELYAKLQKQLMDLNQLIALFLDTSQANHSTQNQYYPIEIKILLLNTMELCTQPQRLHLSHCDASTLTINPLALKRVMSNLLENALKYTEEKVLIEAYKSEHYFTISVNDYGSGLSEQNFQSLSKPFVRGQHTTTSHNRVGSGLGLSIVHYLCQTQGWKVVAKSHLDSSAGLSIQIQIPYQ